MSVLKNNFAYLKWKKTKNLLIPFSIVSNTKVDASCTYVLAEALDHPDTLDDSEIDDLRDKFIDGKVPLCDGGSI